ncbi:hypothetical protein BJ741DRAFT_618076 [Chytriomyces cf. hyalinus JEL632]|nr:hypothetical protein BJ741DRAFT_618076 [Chytriomyces cf. hyalinus JEL632]
MSEQNKMHLRFLVEENHQADTSTSHSIPQMAAVEAGDTSQRDDVKIGFGMVELSRRKTRKRQVQRMKAPNRLRNLKQRSLRVRQQFAKTRCKICRATFKSSQNLKQHGWTHSQVRPHECPDCGASFKWGSTLKRHRQLEH